MKETSVFTEYEEYYNKYTNECGPKTALLYQNGVFFEMYGVDNGTEKIGDSRKMAKLLNLTLTKRNKEKDPNIDNNDRINHLIVGFKIEQLDRFASILLNDHNYTVVVVRQLRTGDKPPREVTDIWSPGANLEYDLEPLSSQLLCIYIENEGTKSKEYKNIKMITIGLAIIDLTTGKNIVHEICNNVNDENKAIDDTYRFVSSFKLKEVIIHCSEGNLRNQNKNPVFDVDVILSQLKLDKYVVHRLSEIPKEYKNIVYQNEFLSKFFRNTGILDPISYLNLERSNIAIISYITLLNFCYKRNENILSYLHKVQIWDTGDRLVLDTNCIEQIDLMSRDNYGLYDLLDNNTTNMGKRMLRDRLTSPFVEPKAIRQEYEYISAFSESESEEYISKNKNIIKYMKDHKLIYKFQKYESLLKSIDDIERLNRKLVTNQLKPNELLSIYNSYKKIIDICLLLKCESNVTLINLISDEFVQEMENFIKLCNETIDFNILGECPQLHSINPEKFVSFFKKGYNRSLDKLQNNIDVAEDFFQELCKFISDRIIKGTSPTVKYETVKLGKKDKRIAITTTATRFRIFKQHCVNKIEFKSLKTNKKYSIKVENLQATNVSSKCIITSGTINKMSSLLIEARKELVTTTLTVFKEFNLFLTKSYQIMMQTASDLVTKVDFYKSNAKTSLLYNYCKPVIDETSDSSYIDVVQLRHPLIEQNQSKIKYVPHDLSFRDYRGRLIFGINMSGKTCLMKAVGISVVMAQMGFFVPAKEFTFSPYRAILTRIIGNDDMKNNKSSFAVEMSELLGILNRVDKNVLVLGDEVCRGTETLSGTSIMAHTIGELSKSKASFLFATHLHELTKFEEITDIKTLKICHLKFYRDSSSGEIVYDRSLQDGQGSSIYGLEVLKSLGFDESFIEGANKFRKRLLGISDDVLSTSSTKYHKDLFIGECCIPECKNKSNHTHHIQFQSLADEHGFVDNVQKNHLSNLVRLCEDCHHMVHNSSGKYKFIIKGYVMTTAGIKLDYEKVEL